MRRIVLRSKLHGARITATELYYEGSITIDQDLLDQADILPYEWVQVGHSAGVRGDGRGGGKGVPAEGGGVGRG